MPQDQSFSFQFPVFQRTAFLRRPKGRGIQPQCKDQVPHKQPQEESPPPSRPSGEHHPAGLNTTPSPPSSFAVAVRSVSPPRRPRLSHLASLRPRHRLRTRKRPGSRTFPAPPKTTTASPRPNAPPLCSHCPAALPRDKRPRHRRTAPSLSPGAIPNAPHATPVSAALNIISKALAYGNGGAPAVRQKKKGELYLIGGRTGRSAP